MKKIFEPRTKTGQAMGMITLVEDDTSRIYPAMVTVRATNDRYGKSVSLAAEDVGVMIQIPLEKVMDCFRFLLGGDEVGK